MKQILRTEFVLSACLLAFVACGEPNTVTYAPEAASYVQSGQEDTLHNGVIPSDTREGVMRLDVNGMENCTNAVLRLFCTQHNNNDYNPVVLRQMRDVDWLESQATLNALRHEFPVFPSPWIAPQDPLYVGRCDRVPGLFKWMEINITEAVKREARRTGKLAFAVLGLGWRGDNNTPTSFAGMNHTNLYPVVSADDPSVTNYVHCPPQFVVSWKDGESRGASRTWVKCPCTDSIVYENGKVRKDEAYLCNRDNRESFFKFDLSALTGGVKVRRAIIKFSRRSTPNAVTTAGYLKPFDNIDWTDANYTHGTTFATLPHGKAFKGDTTTGAVNIGSHWKVDFVNEADITSFVKDALAAGKDKLSLHTWVTDGGYMIGTSNRATDGREGPIIWVDTYEGPTVVNDSGAVKVSWEAVEGATGYTVERSTEPDSGFAAVATATGTEAHDVTLPGVGQYWYRVVAKVGDEDVASPATYYQETVTLASRNFVHYTRVNNFSNKDSSSNSSNSVDTTSQTGSSDSENKPRVLNTYLMFDPKGLEPAPFVRLRVRVTSSSYAPTTRRVFATVTERWDCTKPTWNNMMAEFDADNIEDLKGDTVYANEIASMKYGIGNTEAAKALKPTLEFDVTDLAHRAAREGKVLTVLLSASRNTGWTWYDIDPAKNCPMLVYPPIKGFASEFTGEVDRSGENPAAAISWTACPGAASYKVERLDTKKNTWSTLAAATAETSIVDQEARPDREYVYRVTATRTDGETAVAEMRNRLDVDTSVFTIFDAYIQNANTGNPAFCTTRSTVIKDGGESSSQFGNGTREAIFRFDLSELPSDAKTIKLRLNYGALGDYSKKNQSLCFRVLPDRDYSNDNPPTWSDIVGTTQKGSTPTSAAGVFQVFDISSNGVPMKAFGSVETDVTAQIAEAKAKGDGHIFFHVFVKDPDRHNMNFGFYTIESPYSPRAARLVCTPKSWVQNGMAIIFR